MRIASTKLYGIIAAICTEHKVQFKKMTKREKQVLKLIVEGHSSQSIASELNISKNTVGTHRKNIARKINLKTPKETVLFALAFDMLE